MSKRRANRLHRLRREKRGVVLLVVVSLLTLFLMIGVTYVLIAGNYQNASAQNQRAHRYGDEPEREAEEILGQLLYGSVNRRSAIGPHNLLADVYGRGGVAGTVNAAASQTNGQSIALTVTALPLPQQPFGNIPSTIPHYYAGRVLTFTDGTAAGLSTRILVYFPPTNLIIVETPESDLPIPVTPSVGSRFIINGSPFAGTGFGFDNTTTFQATPPFNLEALDTMGANGLPVALLPNFSAYPFPVPLAVNLGGENESWDAVDYQNMAMAMVPPGRATDPTIPIIPSFHRPELFGFWFKHIDTTILTPAGITNGQPNSPTASLKEYLVLAPYGNDGVRNNGDDPSELPLTPDRDTIFRITQECLFRPMPGANPSFSGSNPQFSPALLNRQNANQITFALLNGFWDVDNDGDGIADSIWVDSGLPVVTAPNGRRYKRLVAICCKDLDGRINLNTAGNLQQLANQNYRADQTPSGSLGLYNPATTPRIPRGIGFGPSEMDFLHVFGAYGNVAAVNAYQNLLSMRYGNDGAPGQAGIRDPFSIIKQHGLPNTYTGVQSWYASPPDVWGRGSLVLDYNGHPVTAFMGQNNETLDNPYEIQVTSTASSYDAPYTVSEMERLLRFHDQGTGFLSSRLLNGTTVNYLGGISGTPNGGQRNRELFTTISSHIPATASRMPRELLVPSSKQSYQYLAAIPSPNLLDLYWAKLLDGTAANPQAEINKMVPWEIRHGQRFDINRFLGDGFDNDNNGTVDDPGEAAMGETAWVNDPLIPAQFRAFPAFHSNDVDMNNDAAYNATDFYYGRQLYARHLYCLMMFLVDNGYNPPFVENTLTQAAKQELSIRRIAQWAINAVDFRDPDAIMTPFEYDANPFNGWDVDGNLQTDGTAMAPENVAGQINNGVTSDRRLVWGAEYPDLLMTETIAFHDKRTKDTTIDNDKHKQVGNMAGDDDDVDQFRIPQGSLFVELYCPRNRVANNPRLPYELYDQATGRLRLGQLAPASSSDGVQRPVWRIAISKSTRSTNQGTNSPYSLSYFPGNAKDSTSFEPENMSLVTPVNQMNPTDPPTMPIERLVSFANYIPPAGASALGDFERTRTFYNSLGWDVSVEPGQYAVVGPRTTTYLGSQDDGNPSTLFDGNSAQAVTMKILNRGNPNDTGATINDVNGAPNPLATPGVQIRSVVGIVADMAPPASWANQNRRVGLNVTEPRVDGAFYYQEPNSTNDGRIPVDAYDDPLATSNSLPDYPLDYRTGDPVNDPIPINDFNMQATQTYENCRSLFLQRLANPLVEFHPVLNPYITIDWASTDVTVFTGEEDINNQPNGRPVDMNDPPNGNPDMYFNTRQRNDRQTAANNVNVWSPRADFPNFNGRTPKTGAMMFMQWSMTQTLGFLNSSIDTPGMTAGNIGEPQNYPFPWLCWNNRPYTSPMELLLVPSSSPARLLYEMQEPQAVGGALRSNNPYIGDATNGEYSFRHLLNFYHSAGAANQSANFVRILDCVEVPSQYLGTEKWFDPSAFSSNAQTNTAADTFHPPFNKLSRFRDPGRINLNTIFDQAVLEAAVKNMPAIDPSVSLNFRDRFNQSRQGYPGAVLTMNPDYPTRFANPFRSADSADLMPALPNGNMRRPPVEATLMRSDAVDATTAPTTRPLLKDQNIDNLGNYAFNNIDRNAYFHYEAHQKLGNMFTTQSNCYAVWMTIGYFEVEQNPGGIDSAHPDGLRLAQEVGVDEGNVKRHRAFYIIDRSIPVAFEPGHRHNTDKAVLLKRFIE